MGDDTKNQGIKIVNQEDESNANHDDDQQLNIEDHQEFSLKSDDISNMNTSEADNFSAVATGKGSKRFLILGLCIVASITIYLIYKNISGESVVEQTPSEKILKRSETEANELVKNAKPLPSSDQNEIMQAPKLPTPLPIKAPQPPEPPPPPVPLTPQSPVFPQLSAQSKGISQNDSSFSPSNVSNGITDIFSSKEDDQEKLKAMEARRKASIMVLGGSSSTNSDDGKDNKDTKNKPKSEKVAFLGFGEGSFGENSIAKTSFAQVKATHIGRLDNLIVQGKIIHGVLETAINTDLPGALRAIISRDVYAEAGNEVLIPKGSRVIGTYDSQIKAGQDRVAIAWDRIIRPDGVDIAIASQGTDVLGRSGAAGFLDNKFLTKLGNALLISYIVPSLTNQIFSGNASNNTPITTSQSSSAATGITTLSTTSTFKQQQLKESQDKFNQVMSKAIQEAFPTSPTIFIDQGTEINIFVNKDLIFPDEALTNSSKLIR